MKRMSFVQVNEKHIFTLHKLLSKTLMRTHFFTSYLNEISIDATLSFLINLVLY